MSGPRSDEVLAGLAATGDRRAGAELVERLRRLVYHWVGRYRRVCRTLDVEDLAQEGRMGVLHAARLFDPGKGEFATYAHSWVRAYVRDAVVRDFAVLKVDRATAGKMVLSGFRERLRQLEAEGRPAREIDRALKTPPGRASSLWRALGVPRSLDERAFEDGPTLGEGIASGETPEDAFAREERRSEIRERVADSPLDSRLRTTVEMRLLSDEPATLAEVGRRLGVTKQAALNYEVSALRRLRRVLADLDRPARVYRAQGIKKAAAPG